MSETFLTIGVGDFTFLMQWNPHNSYRYRQNKTVRIMENTNKPGYNTFVLTHCTETYGLNKGPTLQCTGKPYLLKAQHSAFNIVDSKTIPLTVQNWQITSFVPDSTDLVLDSSNICLAVRTVGMQRCPGFHKNVIFPKWTNQIAEIVNFLDSTTLCWTRYAAFLVWIKFKWMTEQTWYYALLFVY